METSSRAMGLMFERPAVLVPALVVMGLAALTLAVDAVWGKALVWNLSEGLVDLNVPLLVGLCIGLTVIRSWAVAATAMLVARATSEETFSLKQALHLGLRPTPSVFLLGLAGIVVGLLVVGLPALFFSWIFACVLALRILVYIALGVWTVFLVVLLSLSAPAVSVDKLGPLEALGESWGLSRRPFLSLLGLLLLLVVCLVLGLLELIPYFGIAVAVVAAGFLIYLPVAALPLAYLALRESRAEEAAP